MICPKCQKENAEGANFCNHCGSSLIETEFKKENVLIKVALILCSLFFAPLAIPTLIVLAVKKNGAITFDEYVNSFRVVLGWFFAVMFLISMFSEGNAICRILVITMVALLCPYTSNIIEKKTNLRNYGKTKAITMTVLFILTCMVSGSATSNKQEATPAPQTTTTQEVTSENKSAVKDNIKIDKPQQKANKKKAEYKAPIAEGAYDILPTEYGKGYDKTINRHGVANIKKSNELLPKAAEIVSRNTSCDKVTWVMLSDNKSTRDNLVIITDCSNGKRFFLSEQEIAQNVGALSESQKLEKLVPTHMAMCEARIKNSLNYPSTYKKLISKTGWETEDYVNDIVIGFKAKNAFNLETEHTARCMINSSNQFSLFDIKEKK